MRIYEKFHSFPWYILPTSWEGLAMRVGAHSKEAAERRLEAVPMAAREARPKVDYCGDPIPQMEIRGNVAIVPVSGPLMKGATGFEKWAFGIASHDDIASDLLAAKQAGISKVVMNMNSPGGTVMGTPELADLVAKLVRGGMTIFDFTQQVKASAAEYITAAASGRFGTKSCMCGSIGTILETVDASKFFESIGIQYNVFASGKFKAMGHPAKPLTPEQTQWIEEFVAQRATEFKMHMSSYRPRIKSEAMEGQIFTGEDAVKVGLLTANANSLDEVVEMIQWF